MLFRSNDDDSSPRERVEALPKARQDALNSAMRQFEQTKTVYPVGASTYLLWTPEVMPLVETVRRIQKASPAERAAFIRGPQAYLKALAGAAPGEEEVEPRFDETTTFSDRVREIGIWQPKIRPFIKQGSQDWIPVEEGGLCIGEKRHKLTLPEARELLGKLQSGLKTGEVTVKIGRAHV